MKSIPLLIFLIFIFVSGKTQDHNNINTIVFVSESEWDLSNHQIKDSIIFRLNASKERFISKSYFRIKSNVGRMRKVAKINYKSSIHKNDLNLALYQTQLDSINIDLNGQLIRFNFADFDCCFSRFPNSHVSNGYKLKIYLGLDSKNLYYNYESISNKSLNLRKHLFLYLLLRLKLPSEFYQKNYIDHEMLNHTIFTYERVMTLCNSIK